MYENAAHTLHDDDQFPDFLNAVVEAQISIGEEELLDHCQKIEECARRERLQSYGPMLDLDLLVVDGIVCNTRQITLPHPRLEYRRFILQPWYDFAPDYMVPRPAN